MRDKLIVYLEKQIKIASDRCEDIWSESGNLGSCYFYEVTPIRELLNYVKNLPEDTE